MKYVLSLGLLLLLGCQSGNELKDEIVGTQAGIAPVSAPDTFDLNQGLSTSAIIGSGNNKILATDTISENLFLTRYIGDNRFLGIVIWTIEDGAFNPIWQEKDSSDFPPHTYSFVDYNGDGKRDVTILAGQEDVFNTYVYLNNATKTYSPDNFKLVHQNWNNYAAIVDVDADGIPELLDSVNEQIDSVARPEFFLPDEAREEVNRKYDAIAGVAGAKNFDFELSDRFRVYNTFLMDSIKVMGFENGSFKDKTCRYKAYLDWRIAILEQMKKDSRNDTKYINELIGYHKKKKACS